MSKKTDLATTLLTIHEAYSLLFAADLLSLYLIKWNNVIKMCVRLAHRHKD